MRFEEIFDLTADMFFFFNYALGAIRGKASRFLNAGMVVKHPRVRSAILIPF